MKSSVRSGQPVAPLDVYREWNACLLAGDFQGAARYIDRDRWLEKCLGLTDWLTDFDGAVTHYVTNMVRPWDRMEMREEDVIEGQDAVTVRFCVEATHIGPFLGVQATGRRIAFDAIRIVKISNGLVTGQWAQLDLWGIHSRLTAPRTPEAERSRT
ncbi:ester cyclase [Streptomyces morookaense]|uniref:ester cyclase n=1 Tax=Streptomyces morookaense TaxID=1970 RepID=UPI0033DE007A